MMYVTTAANDHLLRWHLKRMLGKGVIVESNIPFGDTNVHGIWFADEPIKYLDERKSLGDIVKCIDDGRYLQQWQRAKDAGWGKQYLYAEVVGQYQEDYKTGLAKIKRGKRWITLLPEIEAKRIESFLMEVEDYLGVTVVRTRNVKETAKCIVRRYILYRKPPEHHASLKRLFTPSIPNEGLMSLFSSPSISRKALAQLPDIGWDRSKDIEEHFGSIKKWVNADEEEWLEIEGIGKKITKAVREAIRTDYRDEKKLRKGAAGDIDDLY